MRSGLKHLLAYQLTQPNKQCYLISRSFAFHVLVIKIQEHVEITRDKHTTKYIKPPGHLILYNSLLTVHISNVGVYLKSNDRFQIICDNEGNFSDIEKLVQNCQFKEIIDYCHKLFHN